MKKGVVSLVLLGFVVAMGISFHSNVKVSAQELGPGPMTSIDAVSPDQQPGPGPI